MAEGKQSPPKYTKACVLAGFVSVCVFGYGVWFVKASHQSTAELTGKIKHSSVPTNTIQQKNPDLSRTTNETKFSAHLEAVLSWSDDWYLHERRGKHLIFSDSICFGMKPPTPQTDVKSFRGIRVDEALSLLYKYPNVVAGYDTVIVHLGTNNLYAKETPDSEPVLNMFSAKDIHKQYKNLHRKIIEINPNCVIYSSSILPRMRDYQLTYDKAQEVNSLLAADFGQKFIDLGNDFATVVQENGKRSINFKKEHFNEDGLHLTVSGKNVLSEIIRKLLPN